VSTAAADPILELVERVAEAARELGIETALIGAVAMAAYNYVRGTGDADLATHVDPHTDLSRLRDALGASGLHVELRLPDEEDPLGGVLRVWQREDEDGMPADPVDVVNFDNPHRPGRLNPGRGAVRNASQVEGTKLRCVRLPDLIALKLYTGGLRDQADVLELLLRNPDVDFAEIEAVCSTFGLGAVVSELIDRARGIPR
jgi:hypothetical protein